MDMKDIEWRGWQRDLRQYLDKPRDRKVIWVVGKEGYEGGTENLKDKWEWREWQRDLRQQLDEIWDRKVIWVVGKEGNEGK